MIHILQNQITMLSRLAETFPSSKIVTRDPEWSRGTHEYTFTEDSRLSKSCWWTGIRINVPLDQYVCSTKAQDDLLVSISLGTHEWVQSINTWRMLPWPIPAHMASILGLPIKVTVMYSENAPLLFGISLNYENLPTVSHLDRFMFVNNEGHPIHMWDGIQEVDGTEHRGAQIPQRQKGDEQRYRIIPPCTKLFGWKEWVCPFGHWNDDVDI